MGGSIPPEGAHKGATGTATVEAPFSRQPFGFVWLNGEESRVL
jgi:hypothetical protein